MPFQQTIPFSTRPRAGSRPVGGRVQLTLSVLLALRFMALVLEEGRNLALGLAMRGVDWKALGPGSGLTVRVPRFPPPCICQARLVPLLSEMLCGSWCLLGCVCWAGACLEDVGTIWGAEHGLASFTHEGDTAQRGSLISCDAIQPVCVPSCPHANCRRCGFACVVACCSL